MNLIVTVLWVSLYLLIGMMVNLFIFDDDSVNDSATRFINNLILVLWPIVVIIVVFIAIYYFIAGGSDDDEY